jgi:hypothetical protein
MQLADRRSLSKRLEDLHDECLGRISNTNDSCKPPLDTIVTSSITNDTLLCTSHSTLLVT